MDSWVWTICSRGDRLPTPVFLGFSCGLAGKESACNGGDLGSVPGLVRSPGERKGYPLQYSGLENSTDCIVHGVAKSRTRLSNFTFIFTHFNILGIPLVIQLVKKSNCNAGDPGLTLSWDDALEKGKATHSSILA